MFPKKTRTIYLIGIKGTGMSSLAVLLKKLGYRVSGSDTAETFFTESQLKKHRIPYRNGFNAASIKRAKPDLVIASTAYTERNPELAEAKLLKLPLLTYPETLGALSAKLTSVAVCGSHGKTTTTSLLGFLMQSNGKTATVTGTVADALNHRVGKPEFFVFEADEYQNKLALYSPAHVILTNVDYDHPDYFKDKKHYRRVFVDFVKRTLKNRGSVLYNSDDPEARAVCAKLAGAESYGVHRTSTYQIANINRELNRCTLIKNNKPFLDMRLSIYGKHNLLNAAAAAVTALRLGVSRNTIEELLKKFKGVKRRMERIPNSRYTLIDDYGHHPTEIAATLGAIRNRYPKKRIVTVFHPHTFSRTKALLNNFAKSFSNTDLVLVLDIYPSARETGGDVHARDVVKAINRRTKNALYQPTIADAAEYLTRRVKRGSVILTIGAGDVWKLGDLIR